MAKRMVAWKRAILAVSLGGAAFQIGVGGCVSNSAYEAWFQGVGNGAIQVGANSVGNAVGTDFNTIVAQPTGRFFQTLWSTYIDLRFADDVVRRAPIVQ